ncbi:MAG: class B sortase, partial [Acutalibacteraceae bacterium]
IDYPIVQNEEDDYYLRRSIYKKYLFAGSIYTNKSNSKDFTDPVTVIYGHNMRNDTMFCMLHEFENKEFFDNNEFFYIYTPGHKYTYRVVSALKYDNRRITAAYDFSDMEQLESFQYSIMNPKFDLFNSRDIKLTDDDKIVTLSTCVANKPKYRYLVNGVLVKDELTK